MCGLKFYILPSFSKRQNAQKYFFPLINKRNTVFKPDPCNPRNNLGYYFDAPRPLLVKNQLELF